MKLIFIIWILLGALNVFSLDLPRFYHTSDQVFRYLKNISCPALKSRSSDIIHAYHLSSSSNPSLKVFLLFGEHPRELISTELGFKFIKEACNGYLSGLLEIAEIMIVLNANPKSRSRVENGEFCLRTNQNGVDINRN